MSALTWLVWDHLSFISMSGLVKPWSGGRWRPGLKTGVNFQNVVQKCFVQDWKVANISIILLKSWPYGLPKHQLVEPAAAVGNVKYMASDNRLRAIDWVLKSLVELATNACVVRVLVYLEDRRGGVHSHTAVHVGGVQGQVVHLQHQLGQGEKFDLLGGSALG